MRIFVRIFVMIFMWIFFQLNRAPDCHIWSETSAMISLQGELNSMDGGVNIVGITFFAQHRRYMAVGLTTYLKHH